MKRWLLLATILTAALCALPQSANDSTARLSRSIEILQQQMKLSTIRLHQYWILREEHDAMVGHATGKLRWDEKALQQQFLDNDVRIKELDAQFDREIKKYMAMTRGER